MPSLQALRAVGSAGGSGTGRGSGKQEPGGADGEGHRTQCLRRLPKKCLPVPLEVQLVWGRLAQETKAGSHTHKQPEAHWVPEAHHGRRPFREQRCLLRPRGWPTLTPQQPMSLVVLLPSYLSHLAGWQ